MLLAEGREKRPTWKNRSLGVMLKAEACLSLKISGSECTIGIRIIKGSPNGLFSPSYLNLSRACQLQASTLPVVVRNICITGRMITWLYIC